MRKDFFPDREVDMVSWGANFALHASADPGAFGLTPEQAAEFAAVQGAFADAFAVASAPVTRTGPAVLAKDTARKAMERLARQLVAVVKACKWLPAERRVELRLSVTPPGRGPALSTPSRAPAVHVEAAPGRAVSVWLTDVDRANGRARPRGVGGAILFRHVGEAAPDRRDSWVYAGQTGRTSVTLTLPADVRPGTKVWISAAWLNPRGEIGPMSSATSAYVGS